MPWGHDTRYIFQLKTTLISQIPYLGIGFARNSINLSEAASYTSAGVLAGKSNLGSGSETGILLSAGLNYKVNDRTKLFTELRYTEASYDMAGDSIAYSFDVEGSSMIFGFSRTFDASPLSSLFE